MKENGVESFAELEGIEIRESVGRKITPALPLKPDETPKEVMDTLSELNEKYPPKSPEEIEKAFESGQGFSQEKLDKALGMK